MDIYIFREQEKRENVWYIIQVKTKTQERDYGTDSAITGIVSKNPDCPAVRMKKTEYIKNTVIDCTLSTEVQQ